MAPREPFLSSDPVCQFMAEYMPLIDGAILMVEGDCEKEEEEEEGNIDEEEELLELGLIIALPKGTLRGDCREGAFCLVVGF